LKITEFLQGRGVERQAVTRYINRHEDVFKGHTERSGKEIELDEFAVAELDRKYPLLKPVTVIDGVPQAEFIAIQKELIESHRQLEALQSRMLEMSNRVAIAEAQELLLEDRTRQLEALQAKEEAKEQEIRELREALEQERSKSWLQKLFGK